MAKKKSESKSPSYAYTIKDDKIEFDGPSFMHWCDQANKLPIDVCIAVVLAAQANPFPMGVGRKVLEHAFSAAVLAVRTDGGRQLPLEHTAEFGPLTRMQVAACEVLLSARRTAVHNNVSVLAVLRLLLCKRSHDACNAPYDSYMRLATNTLEKY